MRRDPANSEFMSTREAAAKLGVALRTIQLWVESGVLRAWKTAGGHRRIVRASVEKLLRERDAAVASATSPAASGTRPFRLLVVEDEPALLKMFTLYVEGWKLPVELVTATNGFDGLVRIGELKPDLLVTDLNMPGMDGFRMIRSLHASPDYRNLDIIVVTALGKREIADRGGLPPDVKVFTKPIPFTELERIVRERVGRRQSEREEAAPTQGARKRRRHPAESAA